MKKILAFLLLIIPMNYKAIETSATSAILMDMDTHRIMYAKNIHNVRSVASISKIMTAIIAIESDKLNKTVIIGDEINKAYGSGIYIKKGEKLLLIDLVYGLMLRSGNDAAASIAHYVGKNEENFVKLMNEKAVDIGMKNTTFNNPSGLDQDKGNYSTAYDMAILTSYAMKNKIYRKITSTKEYKLNTNMNNYLWKNKNKLLKKYKYTTGGKTGFTENARRTLVTTATKDNMKLVVVTLNDSNDWYDHEQLFEYGFANYKTYKILNKGKINIYSKYYKNYNLYIKKNFNYTLSLNEKGSIKVKYKLEKYKHINNGKKIGTAYVYLGDELIHKEKIYISKKNNTKKGIQKVW